jgi:carotenoid 1,2-hydratase
MFTGAGGQVLASSDRVQEDEHGKTSRSVDMLAIASPDATAIDRALQAPGGFAWWYLDLVSGPGEGVVLIWAYGLPFLPGHAAAQRGGAGSPALARPSLNLAVYREGRPVIYLLQEYGEAAPPEVSPGGIRATLGNSTLEMDQDDGSTLVRVRLDCPLPGRRGRLQGTVTLQGPTVRAHAPEPVVDGDADHLWSVLSAPATGEARIEAGGVACTLRGRGYHDCNASRVPLHELGIERWLWGRIALDGHELILYHLVPEHGELRTHLLRIDEAGAVSPVEGARLVPGRERRARFGLRYPGEIEVGDIAGQPLRIALGPVVDDGPFYLRFALTAMDGATGSGWGEMVVPGRVDLARHRPLVRMRVHRPGARNSLWLPLFSGPREGRVRALLPHLLRGMR